MNVAVAGPAGVEHLAQRDSRFFLGSSNWIGRPVPFHAAANGKVFLAFGAAKLPRGALTQLTEHTVVDRAALELELAVVRERGWATTVEELEPGLLAVAAPVRDGHGDVIAALSVSAPVVRLPAERLVTLGPLVAAAAARVPTGASRAERRGGPRRRTAPTATRARSRRARPSVLHSTSSADVVRPGMNSCVDLDRRREAERREHVAARRRRPSRQSVAPSGRKSTMLPTTFVTTAESTGGRRPRTIRISGTSCRSFGPSAGARVTTKITASDSAESDAQHQPRTVRTAAASFLGGDGKRADSQDVERQRPEKGHMQAAHCGGTAGSYRRLLNARLTRPAGGRTPEVAATDEGPSRLVRSATVSNPTVTNTQDHRRPNARGRSGGRGALRSAVNGAQTRSRLKSNYAI